MTEAYYAGARTSPSPARTAARSAGSTGRGGQRRRIQAWRGGGRGQPAAVRGRVERAAGERSLRRCASDGSTMRRRKEQAPKTCGVRLICKFGFFPFKFSS